MREREIVRHCELPKDFGRRFDVEELHDDSRGLRIVIRSSDRRVEISFADPLSYRVSYEGDVPELSSMLGHSPSGVAVLSGRGWLDELFGLDGILYKNVQVTHWAIGGSNQLVEVISTDDPVIAYAQ